MYFGEITYIISIIIYFFINLKLIRKIYVFKDLFVYFLLNSIFIMVGYYKVLIDNSYLVLKNKNIIYFFVVYFMILFIKFLVKKNKDSIVNLFIISVEFFLFEILLFGVGLILLIINVIFSPDTTLMDILINLH